MTQEQRLEAFKAALQKAENEFEMALIPTLNISPTGVLPQLQVVDKKKAPESPIVKP